MLLKHRILDKLYEYQLAVPYVAERVELNDISLDINELIKELRGKEKEVTIALEGLSRNDEVYIDWEKRQVAIIADGINSLSEKKYYNEYVKWKRERVFFWLKVIGLIGIVISIILGIYELIGLLDF